MTDLNTPALQSIIAEMRCTSHLSLQAATDQCGRWADQLESLTAPSADWVMVPREPTREMLVAYAKRLYTPEVVESWEEYEYEEVFGLMRDCYKATISAAPLPEPPKDAK